MLDDMKRGQDAFGPEQSSNDGEMANGIAYDKIRSVYTSLKSDEIKTGKFVVEELIQEPSVKEVLGAVKEITSPTSKELLESLKNFIDSKEKTRGRKPKPDAMEYWPLIKGLQQIESQHAVMRAERKVLKRKLH